MVLIGSPDACVQVYLSFTKHWTACTLRNLVHARTRRTVTHQLQVRTFTTLAGAGLEIVSTALPLVRDPTERTGKEEA